MPTSSSTFAAPSPENRGEDPADPFDADMLALAEQSAGIGIWSIDLTTGLVRGTAQYFRIMGLEASSRPIPMEAIRSLRHPDDRERVLAGFKRVLEGGADSYEIEYRIVRPDGETRWIFGRGRVIRGADGTPIRYSGVDLDITERKALEESLRGSEDRLRLAVDAGQLGIWDWDIVNDRVKWTDRVYELHGVAQGAFGGRLEDFARLVHPDDMAAVRTSIEIALNGETPYEVEFRVPLPDGSIRWLATRAHVIRDEHGNPSRMVGATYDVTERVLLLEAERNARSSAEAARRHVELLAVAGGELARSLEPKQTLEAIARTMVPALADWCRIDIVDGDGILQRGISYHSDPEKSRIGSELVQRLRAAPETPGSMGWAVATGQSRLCHFDPPLQFDSIRDRDLLEFARAIAMRAYFVVPLVARGRTLGALAALQAESGRGFDADSCALIVELAQRAALALDNARLYAEAETALQQAKSANQAKDQFLAMLGHELRNPLAPISMALHLMDLRQDEDHAKERGIIRRQVQHMARLIDDLHDVSRISSGKLSLRFERTELGAIVDKALEIVRPLTESRSGAIDVDVPPGPVHVWGDPVRLAQALSNLLTNANKFTPANGRIALRVVESGPFVDVTVADAGSGIAPELLPHVFDAFVQGQQPADRASGGLGVGLSIVRSLIEMHGGSVTASSDGIGRGSTFTLRLPVLQQATQPSESMERQWGTPAAARILVVDDNVDAAETLAAVLRARGHEVRTAFDAPSAIECVGEFAPDIAVLDIGLPKTDGYELARRLKADPRVAQLRLVALTGYGQAHDRERGVAAGFDEYLVKPLEPGALDVIVARLHGDAGKAGHQES